MEEELKQEINKLKILNDIYINENEKLKYEYRILSDEFLLYKENYKPCILKRVCKRIYRKINKVRT